MFKMSLAQQLGGTGRWVSEFEVNLLYIVTSRTARAIELKPCQQTNKKVSGFSEELLL